MRIPAALTLIVLLLAPLAVGEDAPARKPGEGMTAIVGGDVITMCRGIVRRGTVLIDAGGHIAKVGARVSVPDGAAVIDAAGKKVTPGLVAPLSSGVGVTRSVGGRNRFVDAIDPYDLEGELALSVGITTVFSRTGRGSSSAVFKLAGDLDERILAEPAAVTLTYSGPANRFQLREQLEKARDYLAAKAEFEAAKAAGKKVEEPKKPVSDDYVALVSREMPLRLAVGTADEIRAALGLADEFGIRLVLEGAPESWIVAEEIARRGAAVVLSPRNIPARDRMRDGPSGGTIECARILEERGVRYAVLPVGGFRSPGYGVSLGGIGGRDLLFFPMAAAYAVRGGASERFALAAITAASAEILGVADRVGSLGEGRDADVVIWTGDPLSVTSRVEKVLVNGKVAYDRATSTLWKE